MVVHIDSEPEPEKYIGILVFPQELTFRLRYGQPTAVVVRAHNHPLITQTSWS